MTLKYEKCVMPFVLWINLDIDFRWITKKADLRKSAFFVSCLTPRLAPRCP